jgi:hypothetical protein
MGGSYEVNNAHVVCGNAQTANATVYIIGTVLMPQRGKGGERGPFGIKNEPNGPWSCGPGRYEPPSGDELLAQPDDVEPHGRLGAAAGAPITDGHAQTAILPQPAGQAKPQLSVPAPSFEAVQARRFGAPSLRRWPYR